MLRAATLTTLLAIATAGASTFGFYDEKRHGIINLDSKSFKEHVNKENGDVVLVEFFAP